ncbi:zinc-binding dehydrogenase [Aeromonas sanarellii]|uniref:zinc-binding dehydrogenase n=1 Tax=Aeromonas sanarellii TaxID=633415 RepID=UPI003BA0961E
MSHTQAWCWHAPGEPGQLTLTRQALPVPGANDVLIANRVIALNPVDWKLIEHGHPQWQPGHVPGVDGMGTIVALGANVSHLRLGARVAYHTDLRHGGSFAHHSCVPARALLPVPDALSDEAAAALPCPGLTAWQALAKLPRLHGEALLITGAGSNVGRFAVQLALRQGARVFASASHRHHGWLRQLGVQGVADYREHDWQAKLQAANGGEPFEGIIDLVSSQQAEALLPALGYYGHMVTVLGRIASNPQPPFSHCHSLHEIALGAQHAFGTDRQWSRLVAAGVTMMAQMASGELGLPPLVIGDFEALPTLLDRLKREGQGEKFLVRVA